MDQPTKIGICLTCGFLCRRDMLNPQMSRLFELTFEDRQAERWFHVDPSPEPWCFRCVPILQEMRETSGILRPVTDPLEERVTQTKRRADAATHVITRDRNCHHWMQYVPHLGPEAHFQELRRQQEEQSRREFLEDLERQRQAFESYLEASRQAFTVTLNKANDRVRSIANNVGWVLTLAAILVAVTSLTCESLLWTWAPPLRLLVLGCGR